MNIASIFSALAGLAWLAGIGFAILAAIRAGQGKPIRGGARTVIGILIVAILSTVLGAGMVFIEPPERGVVISALSPTGYRNQALTPGLRWVIPFFETVVRYPISTQNYTMSIAGTEGTIQGDDSIAARTADGQEIYVDASVIFAIDPNKVIEVHIKWQNRYENDLVRAQARGIVRDAVSQYNVNEVVTTKRFELVNNIRTAMGTKLSDNGLILIDFVLRNITFSPEYAASVEQKQIAEQLSQQAKFVVEQKRQEAEQARQVAQGQADAVVIRAKADGEARIISAKAEAEALALISDALKNNPDLLTYQYISKLSPNIQTMLLPSNSPFLLQLPQYNTTTNPTPTVVPTTTP
ncbi:MAG TPA: prohibitin family protein [Longilinea sp.]|nr:prohibitin family protein [Longilinea sp.]